MPARGSLGAKAAAAARRRRRGGQAHNFGRRIALVAAAAIGAALWIKISPLRRLFPTRPTSAKAVPDDYNPLVDILGDHNPLIDNWDDALVQFKARAKNDVLHRTIKSDWLAYTSEYTSAATIAHALRLALGDDAFKERSAPVVVHLAGFASWREDMGMRHDAYFNVFAIYLRAFLPRVERVHLQLIGPEVKEHELLELQGGWLQVSTHKMSYHFYALTEEILSGEPPTLWLAEHPGLYDATWEGDGCIVRRGKTISRDEILAAEIMGRFLPYTCLWRETFDVLTTMHILYEAKQHEDARFPIFVTAAHRGEDTLTRRLFASGTSGLKTSESSWRVEPAEQSQGLNPFAEAMRAHPGGTMGPVGTVDLLNIPGQHPDAYSNRIWHHYVTREPGAFDQHDVFAKNRYLLRIFPPSSGGLILDEDEL